MKLTDQEQPGKKLTEVTYNEGHEKSNDTDLITNLQTVFKEKSKILKLRQKSKSFSKIFHNFLAAAVSTVAT